MVNVTIINYKKYSSNDGFPKVGESIEAYDKMNCLGEWFYLCQYGIHFLSIKQDDAKEIKQCTNGQLSL